MCGPIRYFTIMLIPLVLNNSWPSIRDTDHLYSLSFFLFFFSAGVLRYLLFRLHSNDTISLIRKDTSLSFLANTTWILAITVVFFFAFVLQWSYFGFLICAFTGFLFYARTLDLLRFFIFFFARWPKFVCARWCWFICIYSGWWGGGKKMRKYIEEGQHDWVFMTR